MCRTITTHQCCRSFTFSAFCQRNCNLTIFSCQSLLLGRTEPLVLCNIMATSQTHDGTGRLLTQPFPMYSKKQGFKLTSIRDIKLYPGSTRGCDNRLLRGMCFFVGMINRFTSLGESGKGDDWPDSHKVVVTFHSMKRGFTLGSIQTKFPTIPRERLLNVGSRLRS